MIRKVIVSLFILIVLSGCGMNQDIKEADLFMEKFFNDRIKTGDAGPSHYYSRFFKEVTSDEQWQGIKDLVINAHGKLRSFEQLTWKIETKTHISNLSGTFVFYTYNTVFENDSAVETIALFKNEENPKFRIISHRYNSDNIQKLLDEERTEATEAKEETESKEAAEATEFEESTDSEQTTESTH